MSVNKLDIEFANAICYSGYRENQKPGGDSPSFEEVIEDLYLLSKNWKYIRLYDCSEHSKMTLQIIKDEKLDIKVMIGAYINAEVNNPNCPWGGVYSNKTLAENKINNKNAIKEVIDLANQYSDIIFAISVGNEASVEWNDHMVPAENIINYALEVKNSTNQPVTFCENYLPWLNKLEELAKIVDIISIHTYPVWEYKTIDEAMSYTKQNYYDVANKYPNKSVIITEAGWTTNSNGRGIEEHNANQELQKRYYSELMQWSNENKILTFVFEAFDEPWKGSSDLMEPEKHWGLFTVNRKPKEVLKELFS